jgi:hypothetical protein
MSTQYTFLKSHTLTNRPKTNVQRFYQLCAFVNPKSKLHEARAYIVQDNTILNYKTYHINETTYRKLISTLRENKYRLYATYTLDYIDPPDACDISLMQSEMLNVDHNYSGHATFDGDDKFTWRGILP